jgi:eukaryotic-like serine/threonine-protein kinase
MATLLALCGEVSQAKKIADEIEAKYPNDTYVNSLDGPTARAVMALNRNNFAEALRLLEAARPYELGPASGMGSTFLRAVVYLRAATLKHAQADIEGDAAAKAAAEFQRILDHRALSITSSFYPLAHLRLARAAALRGDTGSARKAYQDFLAMWKNADANIPILQQAKAEYEKLGE